MDDCVAHHTAVALENTELRLLPSNCAAVIQTLDQDVHVCECRIQKAGDRPASVIQATELRHEDRFAHVDGDASH